MRILIGTTEIAGLIPVLADGLRRLGHQVTTVVLCRNPYNPDAVYNIDLSKNIEWPERILQNKSWFVRLPRGAANRLYPWARLAWLIASHQAFIFLWARHSLLPNQREFPAIKKMGKRIISIFVGSDVRSVQAYEQWYTGDKQFVHRFPFADESPSVALRAVRNAERYSDMILSQPNQSVLAIRPYMHFFVPLDLSQYRFHIPLHHSPLVVHAPSRREAKGTDIILEAVRRLQESGLSFEFRLLEGIPNQQVIENLAAADIVIDQLFAPMHGKLALEGMVSGCAVAGGDRQDIEPFPKRPIWPISPQNIREQLEQLLVDKELRAGLAEKGLQYVKQYYDHTQVTRRIMERLNNTNPDGYDHYPSFYACHYQPPTRDTLPQDLLQLTTQIAQRWGLPEGVDPDDLVKRGLMAPRKSNRPIPRWKPVRSQLEQEFQRAGDTSSIR